MRKLKVVLALGLWLAVVSAGSVWLGRDRMVTATARAGWFGAMARLLDLGADPNIPDGELTALHYAILHGDRGAVERLLAAGARVDGWEQSPLVLAIVFDEDEIAALLRSHSPALTVPETFQVVSRMVGVGDSERLRPWLAELLLTNQSIPPFILPHAVRGGDPEIVRTLLPLVTDTEFRRQALVAAVEMPENGWQTGSRSAPERLAILELLWPAADSPAFRVDLLAKAAAADRTDEVAWMLDGRVPLDYDIQPQCSCGFPHTALREALTAAEENSRFATVRLLTERCGTCAWSQWGRLTAAAVRGDSAAARAALAVGEPVDRQDQFNRTALYWAAGSGDPAMVKLLLDAGADPKRGGQDGRTALLAAAAAGSVECIRLLTDAGLPPDQADLQHRTALTEAAEHGHAALVRFLCETYPDQFGPSPRNEALVAAVVAGQGAVARELLSRGADPNAYCSDPVAPILTAAALQGDLELVKELVARGADPNRVTDQYQMDAWMAARFAHHRAVADFLRPLVDHRLPRDERDRHGWFETLFP